MRAAAFALGVVALLACIARYVTDPFVRLMWYVIVVGTVLFILWQTYSDTPITLYASRRVSP